MKRLEGDRNARTIQDKIRKYLSDQEHYCGPYCYTLLKDAMDRIDELEERVAIMSEDQYKSSEIRFP